MSIYTFFSWKLLKSRFLVVRKKFVLANFGFKLGTQVSTQNLSLQTRNQLNSTINKKSDFWAIYTFFSWKPLKSRFLVVRKKFVLANFGFKLGTQVSTQNLSLQTRIQLNSTMNNKSDFWAYTRFSVENH